MTHPEIEMIQDFEGQQLQTQWKEFFFEVLSVPGSINSHYFHIIGDKLINPIVEVYVPIIRIPSLKVGGFPSPNKRDL